MNVEQVSEEPEFIHQGIFFGLNVCLLHFVLSALQKPRFDPGPMYDWVQMTWLS